MIRTVFKLIGEQVVVKQRVQTGTDPRNNPIYSYVQKTVDDVLVQPGATNDIADATRPEGVTIALTLHMPKTFNDDLTGATISVRGHDFKVIGTPIAYTMENTPTRWHMPVSLEVSNG